MKRLISLFTFALGSLSYATPDAAIDAEDIKNRVERAESQRMCVEHLKTVMEAFTAFEVSVNGKYLNEDIRQFFLPWTAREKWYDHRTYETDLEPISIQSSSPALVLKSIVRPTRSTPYTRYEDFSVKPGIAYSDFRLKSVLPDICAGLASKARTTRSESVVQWVSYKYDILAQLNLFRSYMETTKYRLWVLNSEQLFKAEMERIDASVQQLETFVIPAREAQLL